MAKKSNNLFLILGIGCAVLLLVAGLGVVGIGYFGMRQIKEIEQSMKNPEEVARQVLGVEQLPEGYYAQLAMKIPFLMQVVQISDVVKPDEQTVLAGNNGLFYFSMSFSPGDKNELRDFFEGRSENPLNLSRNGIQMEVGEVLDRGKLTVNGQDFLYLTYRGDVQMDQGGAKDGLNSMFLVECSSSSNALRFGFRYGPDPAPDVPAADLDLTTTINHPDQLTQFLEQFNFCKGQAPSGP